MSISNYILSLTKTYNYNSATNTYENTRTFNQVLKIIESIYLMK
uniref:Uncharacterized protein n=1 Tax=Lepeophtheirus salmonis TaxID=72036 RepID=A0A0K2TTL0_LEPSM